MNASTTRGANCVPALRRSSAQRKPAGSAAR